MQAGDKIALNKYTWRVLDVQTDKALLLSDKAIEHRLYHNDFIDITWEQCSLRQYLNNEFFNIFENANKNRIIKSSVSNNKNPWHNTDAGLDTLDYVFLLSIEEIIKYFGDFRPYYSEWKNDPYKNARKMKNANSKPSGWWLRSPGIHNKNVAYLNANGRIFVGGDSVNRIYGVRPALWLRT